MSEILQALPLAEDLTQALLHHQGVLGATLHCVLAYERGQWDEVITCGMQHQVLVNAYLEAIAWANETSNDLTSA
jgi:EAL and modified HD-GYP domain-containing signal transduction protein